MKERPIIMSSEMVRATLDGFKTQTRRVIKPQPPILADGYSWRMFGNELCAYKFHAEDLEVNAAEEYQPFCKCPYGVPGDGLWIKETHYRYGKWTVEGFTKTGRPHWTFKPLSDEVRYFDNPPEHISSRTEIRKDNSGWYKRPSLFMPRWASRITRVITKIRPERLQEISREDIGTEGCPWQRGDGPWDDVDDARQWFRGIWDSLNAKRGHPWENNDWVWRICSEKQELPERRG